MAKLLFSRFYTYLDQPLKPVGRIILALALIPLVLSFTAPLWNIHMEAPQYPKGLDMYIYVNDVKGGHDGQDLVEINNLNHYIGMDEITPETLVDLDWIPFALGLLGLLVLRAAAIGTVRSLIDVAVLTTYVSGVAFYRFVSALYRFGHELAPTAPFKVEPFTPAIFGKKQIANFVTESYPAAGSYFLGVFVLFTIGALLWHLIAGRRAAVREASTPA